MVATIVTQPAAAQAPWSIDSVPTVDVPGTAADGSLQFVRATGGTLLADGTLVIADRDGPAIRFFDASGAPLRSVGRSGEGPGEFREVSWLGQCATDSLFVWDGALNRVTVLDVVGGVERQFRLPGDPAFVTCSRSGTFAVLGFPSDIRPPGRKGESEHFVAPLSLVDRAGTVRRVIGPLPAMESRPLGKVTRFAVSDEWLYVGTNDSAYIDVYAFDGTRAATIALGIARRSPQREHYERAIDAQVQTLAGRDDREAMKQLLLRIPMPEYLPSYSTLFADPTGLLWVVTSIAGDPRTTLRVIARDGRRVTDLAIPGDFTVFEVGADYVLGAWEAESGEPHVALYRVHPPHRTTPGR